MRRLFFAVLALVAGIVLWTCLPVLADPQLEPDDYRYLSLVRDLKLGRVSLLTASVVENRWDHLWWIDGDAVIRFFRPSLFLSFLLDDCVHGGSPRGLLATNVLLHLACCLLVTLLAHRLLRSGPGAAFASLLFAAFACHAEVVWYVSGRNETLAAMGFFAAALLHVGGQRWLALPCFAFALFAKEPTVVLPFLLWLHDRVVARRGVPRRADVGLWLAHAAVVAAYLALRHCALGGDAVPLSHPYFVGPTRPEFPAHVLGQLRNYGENLLCARMTPPFLRPEQILDHASVAGSITVGAAVSAITLLLGRVRLFWWLVAWALATWLPTTVAYVSERHLYLPSFGIAASAGLLLQQAIRIGPSARWWAHALAIALAAALGTWTWHQASELRAKNTLLMHAPRQAEAIARSLADLREQVASTRHLLLVNLPGDVFTAQFLEDQMRCVLGVRDLVCRVLTTLPMCGPPAREVTVERLGAEDLRITGSPLLMTRDAMPFPWRRLARGERIHSERLGFSVEVARGDGRNCWELEFQLEQPVATWTVVTFVPPLGVGVPESLHLGRYLLAGWWRRERL